MCFVSSKGNILCRLINIELYKIFAIINRAIKGLHCIHLGLGDMRKQGTVIWYQLCSLLLLNHPTPTHGPLDRHVKFWDAHAPGMFSPLPWVSDPNMHHSTCVMHVPWCMQGSLTSGFFWSRWQGKRSRYSQHMRNLQFYLSGKRPIDRLRKTFWSSVHNQDQ